MIRYLEHHEIDKKKWDRCVQQAPNAMVYAYSWYLDIVSPGWNALTEEDYTCVFPLTWKKKYGIHYLYQPFFTQQLGIFSVERKITEKKIQEFLSAIPEQYRLIEIQLNAANTFSQKGYKVSERITHHLDLNHSYEKIYNSYSENSKRNIKRAYKSKIELFTDVNASDVIQLFRKNKGKDIVNLGKKNYKMLVQLIHESANRKLISILGAKTSNGKLCAGAVFLESDHEYIFLFSATNEEGRHASAMSLIIDCFIRTHTNENRKLDFEGSMDRNLARFYKSFGSAEVVYLQIKKNNLPSYVRWIKK